VKKESDIKSYFGKILSLNPKKRKLYKSFWNLSVLLKDTENEFLSRDKKSLIELLKNVYDLCIEYHKNIFPHVFELKKQKEQAEKLEEQESEKTEFVLKSPEKETNISNETKIDPTKNIPHKTKIIWNKIDSKYSSMGPDVNEQLKDAYTILSAKVSRSAGKEDSEDLIAELQSFLEKLNNFIPVGSTISLAHNALSRFLKRKRLGLSSKTEDTIRVSGALLSLKLRKLFLNLSANPEDILESHDDIINLLIQIIDSTINIFETRKYLEVSLNEKKLSQSLLTPLKRYKRTLERL